MNILIANWAWYPSGGDWTYIEAVSDLYIERGHNIIPFSMKDERNIPTEYSQYFIDNINYKELNKQKNLNSALNVLKKSIYSTEAINNIELLLKTEKVDLAHLNLIHHYITPAIIKVLKKHNIPIIWTLHDYTILCPQSTFISNDKICEKCRGGKFYQCSLNRCKKESILASSVAAFENYVHSGLNYYKDVDFFICPSAFSYNKYKSFGFFQEKLRQIYHTYKLKDFTPNSSANTSRYIVYVGRLEKIKGVHTLLESMRHNPEIKLKVIGDGSQETELKAFKKMHSLDNVDFLGKLPKDQVLNCIQNSDFLVCPSEWYEVLGYTIYEAMLMEKPVIGSKIGAIPETVIHGETGLLFQSGNPDDLSIMIKTLYNNADRLQMGKNARKHVESLVDKQKYLSAMQEIIPGL
ncbi:MAG: glycosyltransferase family 4 protein [Bacteroidota bacterium]